VICLQLAACRGRLIPAAFLSPLLLGVLLMPSAAEAQSSRTGAPLPDPATLAASVRAQLEREREVLSRYRYLEMREEIRVTKLGKVVEGPVRLFEVHPSAEPGETYKRLIAVDGVPLSDEELEARDREHEENQRRARQERLREAPAEREKRLRQKAREREEEQELLDEIFRTYDIQLLGRETLDGHPVIVARLEPRPGIRPRTDEGELMLKVRGRAWVSEIDHQVVRLELDVFDDLTIGWGIIGRLHKGSRAIFERRRVAEGVWLPAKTTYIASGRSLVFHRFDIETTTEYFGYERAEARNSEAKVRSSE
jgi:hypothetical protein